MKMKPGFMVFVVLLALAVPLAMGAEPKGTFRASLGYMKTGNGNTYTDDYDYALFSQELRVKSTVGASVSYEYRLSDAFGLEAGISYYKPEAEYTEGYEFNEEYDYKAAVESLTVSDKFRMMPVTLGLNYHPLRSRGPADLFFGVELAYITYGDVTLDEPEMRAKVASTETLTVALKNEFTFGLKAGVDYKLSPKWALTASLEYIDAKAELDTLTWTWDNTLKAGSETEDAPSGMKFSPKPIILHVGVSYTF